jgi:hypothetical protein
MDCKPFPVDPILWRYANDEMRRIMDARGWPVYAADIEQPNFLFRGVPIVMEDNG